MSGDTRTGPGWTFYRADYRDTLRAVAEAGGADLIATSPPYCDARTYGAAVSWGDADYASLGDAVWAALKPGGHALINVDAPVREWRRGYGTERGFHPWRLMLDWAERVGFRVPDRLAFGRKGLPGDTIGRFQCGWEPLLWFQRPGGNTWLDKRAIMTNTPAYQRPKTKRVRDGNTVSFAPGLSSDKRLQSGALPDTLWDYGAVGPNCTGAPDIERADHPARWPFRLAEDIIRCFCPPDGLVCDPFLGAGTTAAAAIAHGRRFIGGDLYARNDGAAWVDVAAGIMAERQRQQRLFGGAA